jgi:3-oxoadipate enol-lactonase
MNHRIDGDASRPWLVLSHGLGLDLSMWAPQMPALTRAFRVLRYDARGHGRSPLVGGPRTIEALGRDVLGLLDRERIERAHFCGFSMGGQVAQWLGIHAGKRLHSLVLAHTGARIGTDALWNERIDTVNARGMTAISDAAMQRWFTPAFLASRPPIVAGMKDIFERTSAEGYVRCCAAIRDADFRADMQRIATPTLVIAGTVDPATTLDDGRFLAANIRGAQIVEIASAHCSNIEQPDAFTDAMIGFLAGYRSRAGTAMPASATTP